MSDSPPSRPRTIAEAAAAAAEAAANLPHIKDADAVKLFVGQLPKSYSEDVLRPIFEPFGEIYEFTIIRDKITGAHRGCAFLTYTTKSAADQSIAALHNSQTLPGMVHPLQVKYAEGESDRVDAEHKLFVGKLSKSTSEEELQSLFAPYGDIEEVYILREQSGVSKGCAFIKLRSRDQAIAAIAGLNNAHTVPGAPGPLVVKFADNPKQKERRKQQQVGGANGGGGGGGPLAAVYNSYGNSYPAAAAAAMLNPYLASYYQQAGLASTSNAAASNALFTDLAKLQQNPASVLQQASSAYGALYGAGSSLGAAAAASSAAAGGAAQSEGPPGCNLFLYHLPNEFSDRDLYVNFGPFGNIISTKVFIDKNTGQSKCFGFVSYDNPESAHAAIAAMNGFQIGGKRLKVQLKKDSFRAGPY